VNVRVPPQRLGPHGLHGLHPVGRGPLRHERRQVAPAAGAHVQDAGPRREGQREVPGDAVAGGGVPVRELGGVVGVGAQGGAVQGWPTPG